MLRWWLMLVMPLSTNMQVKAWCINTFVSVAVVSSDLTDCRLRNAMAHPIKVRASEQFCPTHWYSGGYNLSLLDVDFVDPVCLLSIRKIYQFPEPSFIDLTICIGWLLHVVMAPLRITFMLQAENIFAEVHHNNHKKLCFWWRSVAWT